METALWAKLPNWTIDIEEEILRVRAVAISYIKELSNLSVYLCLLLKCMLPQSKLKDALKYPKHLYMQNPSEHCELSQTLFRAGAYTESNNAPVWN